VIQSEPFGKWLATRNARKQKAGELRG